MPNRSNDELPPRGDYYVATVQALQENGGIANIEEIEARVAKILQLSAKAAAVPHGDGRRSQFQYDLAWVRTYLKWAGAVDNPERGIWQLTPLGDEISDDKLREIWSGVVAKQRASRRSLPKVPKQGPGPHFAIERGVLAFARTVDHRGNDLRRLRSLQPIIQETAEALSVALSKHEGLWPALDQAVGQYKALIAGDVRSIDFGRLFGLGIILNNAVRAARENIDGKNSYALPPDCSVLADSLLEMHGPLVLGSKDGQGLLADAERFGADAERRMLLDQSELALGRAIAAPSAPTAQQVKEHIDDLFSHDEDAPRKYHQSAYRGGLVTNAAIVFAGAAALSVVAATAVAGAVLPATLAALGMAVFGNKALQSSKAGKEITDQLSSLIDKVTVDFINDNEALFRDFAKQRRLTWLDRVLDWSLSQDPAENEGKPVIPEKVDHLANAPEILILEPDVETSRALKVMLREWGFVADFAARTEKSALDWAAKRPPDLIISETRLSGDKSGIDAAKAVADLHRCPIIFITAHPEEFLKMQQPDIPSIVPKPIDAHVLMTRINEALSMHRTPTKQALNNS